MSYKLLTIGFPHFLATWALLHTAALNKVVGLITVNLNQVRETMSAKQNLVSGNLISVAMYIVFCHIATH